VVFGWRECFVRARGGGYISEEGGKCGCEWEGFLPGYAGKWEAVGIAVGRDDVGFAGVERWNSDGFSPVDEMLSENEERGKFDGVGLGDLEER
jgi:hypothetical protein